LPSVEAAARIGKWQDEGKREIAALKLTHSAKQFYQGCAELHEKQRDVANFQRRI
jgi:hypothetical protein